MKRFKKANGFTLVEVAVAMAIAVFCLMTIMALLSGGLTSSAINTGEIEANGILNEVAADLRATSSTSPAGTIDATSQQFAIKIPANGTASQTVTTLYFTPQGTSSTTLAVDSRYNVTITFLASAAGNAASMAIIKATWPVSAASPTGVVERFVALDRN